MASNPVTTESYPVYTGIWTNWSRGKIMGATLTLSRQDADFLIAFTAFFIAFISTRTWRILCFCFHRFFSTSSPQEIIYHQCQAILRNSSSPENGIYLFWQLLWAVRNSKRSLRVLPAITIAIVCVMAFASAGVFSSRISTSMGNEVLISSVNCGALEPPSFLNDTKRYFAFQPYAATKVANAATYAQRCYMDNAEGNCDLFLTPRLQSTVDLNASCPFDERMCRSISGNIRLDSGYIDSHKHLGLNTPPDRRILWKHVLHCAPLVTEGYTSQENTPRGITKYHYGNTSLPQGDVDFVYIAPSVNDQYSASLDGEYRLSKVDGYTIQALQVSSKDNVTFRKNSDFEPIAPLARKDADTTFILLSGNGVLLTNTVPDDWYRISSTPIDTSGGNVGGSIRWQTYHPSEPGSALGCAMQYQFCNSRLGSGGCGPLSSLRDAMAGAAPFFDTDYPEIAADWPMGTARTETAGINYFVWMFFGFEKSIFQIFVKLGSMALLSQRTLINGIQGPLPPNQWQQDITYAWNISLALIQGSIIDTAYGPSDPGTLQSWVNFTSPDLKKLCNSQKILSTSHGSFSLFGLSLIFITGAVITVLSYILEPVSAFLCKKGYRQYAHLEWTTNAVLQLQRLAHEELGLGTWSRCADDVPTTSTGEVMASLDIKDTHHPVLTAAKKHQDPGNSQLLQTTAMAQNATVFTAVESEEATASTPSETSDVMFLGTPEPQQDGEGIARIHAGSVESQHVSAPEQFETEAGRSSPILNCNRREDEDIATTPSWHPSKDLSKTISPIAASSIAPDPPAASTADGSPGALDSTCQPVAKQRWDMTRSPTSPGLTG